MFKNNFKIAVRTSLRHKGYAAINLLGLAIGIASFLIIVLYVNDELSYDQFHTDSDRIYRVVVDVEKGSYKSSQKSTPGALRETLLHEVAEVEQATFLHPCGWGKVLLWNEKYRYYDKNLLFADQSFFEVFSFQFIHGDARSAFEDPLSVVLTESMANRFFGSSSEAFGQTLTYNLFNQDKNLKVTAVIKDVPARSHLQFDFLLASAMIRPQYVNNWGTDRHVHTYIKVRPQVSMAVVDRKIQDIIDRYAIKLEGETHTYTTQPMTGLNGIHLSPPRRGEITPSGSKLYIQVLLAVAAFMLLIAGINYVNLATARSATRVKEIGIRKVSGALRKTIIHQFLVESVLLSLLAGVIAIILTALALPFFNDLMQKRLSLLTIDNPLVWLSIPMIVLVFGLISGLYPAFYLSSFRPVAALRKQITSKSNGIDLRKVLVVSQFALSTFLIVGMIVAQRQMAYIYGADLGFDKDQVIVIDNFNKTPKWDRDYIIRNEIERLAGVTRAGGTLENMIGTRRGATGTIQLNPDSPEFPSLAQLVDERYLEVFGLEFVEGRNFLTSNPSKAQAGIILNETAAKKMGILGSAIGQKIGGAGGEIVVGVVKDFHASTLHHEVLPYAFIYHPGAYNAVLKLSGGTIPETLTQIEKIWEKFVPNAPMEYYFLDDRINRVYESELNFKTLFTTMTGLALFIACMGLFGLVAFMAQQRTREIGIRKVLGASVSILITLLSKDFLILVGWANVIAWPIAYLTMNKWLENFAYHINIDWRIFLLSGVIAFVVAALTVSFHTFRTAVSNPVNSLRDG